MNLETLVVELSGEGVLQIELNRPDVRNAFNEVLIGELLDLFSTRVHESDVRAVVLSGRGRAFCAGGDMNWLKKAVDYSYEENLKDTKTLAKMFQVMNESPVPVIGKIHGAAMGGGVGLVSVCDTAICTLDTLFSLSEVRLGVIPACIAPFVVQKIGYSHARSLFTSGERFQGRRAAQIGLVHDLAATEEELELAVQSKIKALLVSGPEAVKRAKKLVQSMGWPEERKEIRDPYEFVAKGLSELRVTDEAQEGLRAFLEKRKPNWVKD